jgi:predicted acyl esterase
MSRIEVADGSIAGPLKSDVRDGMRIDWDVPIQMDDGIVLRADVYRPDAEGTYPAIASYGPYAKGLTFAGGYPDLWRLLTEGHPDAVAGSSARYTAWELLDPEQWVPHGYALVRVDSRGAGRSPGFIDVWSAREAQDFHDCIEWIAQQPWCSGKVGLSGISYFAKNQWQVAALRPPHLAAICPWEGANDFYREMTHHGGIHNSFLPWWYKRLRTIQHGVGSRGFVNPESGLPAAGDVDLTDEELAANRTDLPAEILAHPFDDEWHAERSSRPEDIEAPLLSCANWGGLGQHQHGNLGAWMDAGSKEKWLEVHGGTHFGTYYTEYGQTLQRRFFDWFLKGEGDWEDQPPVSLNVRHADGSLTLRGEQEWPLARTEWRRMYLDPDGDALADEAPAVESARTYEAMGEGVTLSTPPLERETEFTGPLAAKLWISSSTSDADLFLVLRAFDPDGKEVLFQGANDPRTPMSQGWLRASHRKLDPERSQPSMPFHPHDEVEPLTPGEVYEVDVEIWATCIVLPAGYRLALTILGRDFDHGLEPAEVAGFEMRGTGPFHHDHPEDRITAVFDNQVTVYGGGDRASYLLMPEVPPA